MSNKNNGNIARTFLILKAVEIIVILVIGYLIWYLGGVAVGERCWVTKISYGELSNCMDVVPYILWRLFTGVAIIIFSGLILYGIIWLIVGWIKANWSLAVELNTEDENEKRTKVTGRNCKRRKK